MLFVSQPTRQQVQQFIEAQRPLALTYRGVGQTVGTPPAGYVVDRTRTRLGAGRDVFERARSALAQWKHFELGWLHASLPRTPLEAGQVVAVTAHLGPVWWLNACRIVYVIDEQKPIRQFGFAYGTLPDHAESGEERFLLEWDPRDDQVWYDILAFSRPRHPLARLGYPIVRRMQKRFGRDSAAAMRAACGGNE